VYLKFHKACQQEPGFASNKRF